MQPAVRAGSLRSAPPAELGELRQKIPSLFSIWSSAKKKKKTPFRAATRAARCAEASCSLRSKTSFKLFLRSSPSTPAPFASPPAPQISGNCSPVCSVALLLLRAWELQPDRHRHSWAPATSCQEAQGCPDSMKRPRDDEMLMRKCFSGLPPAFSCLLPTAATQLAREHLKSRLLSLPARYGTTKRPAPGRDVCTHVGVQGRACVCRAVPGVPVHGSCARHGCKTPVLPRCRCCSRAGAARAHRAASAFGQLGPVAPSLLTSCTLKASFLPPHLPPPHAWPSSVPHFALWTLSAQGLGGPVPHDGTGGTNAPSPVPGWLWVGVARSGAMGAGCSES